MSHRRQAREMALQILYSLDNHDVGVSAEHTATNYLSLLDNLDDEEKTDMGIKEKVSPTIQNFILHLVTGTWQNLAEIDSFISAQTDHWDFERLAKTDKAILRLACFEILYCDDIPYKVSINEAIELAKIYGEDNSPAFVNGILDGVASKL